MAKFKFEEKQPTPQEHECETCNLINEMLDYIFNVAEDRNEVITYLVDVVYNFKQQGYKDAMKEIAMYSVASIHDLDDCCEECCEDCCDEEACDC